ncbi:divalent metal cation transporter [Chryseolinea sp. T2]|uniref:NRAMP family divalent metal transporter n=1 Tax=Chryseolinea sp. T2 TaxID=3129255 RepID=UPI0030775418
MRISKTWRSVIIWSIISAAFIGPGSVTTAVAAGALYNLDLMWAVTFSIAACIALQEVAARLTIASGLNVGQALIKLFGDRSGRRLQWFLGVSVIGGCAAYEAGNIVGAVAGLQLMTGLGAVVTTVVVSTTCFIVLWNKNPAWIFNLMAFLVALMGVAFCALAATQEISWGYAVRSSVVPVIPEGSHLTILALVGTTVVPYNIFLGSGISEGQTVPIMRVGLIISILMGGLITAAILIAGTTITDFSSFESLYTELETKVGSLGAVALALGLFGAGFASAITSPYAAAVITRTVFEVQNERTVKLVWIGVLLTGFIIGVSGLKPIPVIVVVQAVNGFILPFMVIFLLLVINDPAITPKEFMHGWLYNAVLLITLWGFCMISLDNIDKSALDAIHITRSNHIVASVVISTVVTLATMFSIVRKLRKL